MTRATWKTSYRLLRIARREANKAAQDMVLFGIGFTFISDDGVCKHIPVQDVILKRPVKH